ncbi:MAG: AP2 domain-containing protein [Candidatus Omnitrophota bacterium]
MIRYSTDRLSGRKAGLPDRPAVPFNSGLTITGNSNMKTIQLTRGKVALVDDADYEELNKYKWQAKKNKLTFYATRTVIIGDIKSSRNPLRKRTSVLMHREIVNAAKGWDVDHANHNGLDNRRTNLRLCSRSENQGNRINSCNSTSKYKGVSWDKVKRKWRARIACGKKNTSIGRFNSEIEAAKAYDKKAKELFGEFAYLNMPEEKQLQSLMK